jgi:4-amino-4-deoxy-L-arabinose transferase-like glycosyltransferase
VNYPTPAIVSQGAVRRLPRLALLLFCLAYVLPGFMGRGPWKGADITAYSYMAELALGGSDWFKPTLLGLAPEVDALLPYWLGAWAMQVAPAWLAPDVSARIPFVLLLTLTLLATWYGTYYLARSPEAQPVAFAFGGEALPPDYARALADGGLLAFIACLGLAQLSHETTPALAQLCFTALTFYALAALPYRTITPWLAGVVGLAGLALSGAPTIAALLGLGSAVIYLLIRAPEPESARSKLGVTAGILLVTGLIIAMSSWLDLWRWRIELPEPTGQEWRSLGRLLLWFTWPAWPLALWTLWRWRHQLLRHGVLGRHLALPLWFVSLSLSATFTTASAERSLLLALPALAALAAFSLPTLGRSVAALIDWFTLLFFSGCALIIWVVWIALQTGVPQQPAANVARLAPGFEHSFSVTTFSIAVCATLAWVWLTKWRIGRHRAAIWKSLVLPAGGAALCWLLLMTLWLPLLDYARSYAPLVQRVVRVVKPAQCIEVQGLSRSQLAALKFHGHLSLTGLGLGVQCPWMIVDKRAVAALGLNSTATASQWKLESTVQHPSDQAETLLIYSRNTKPSP